MKPTKSSAMSRSVLTTIDLGIPNQAVSAEPEALALATWMTYLIFSSEEPIVARQVQGRGAAVISGSI